MSRFDLRTYAYGCGILSDLPSHRFFTPTEDFWKKLSEIVPAEVSIVDSGCGMGYLIAEGEKHGRDIMGIDVGYRSGQDERVVRMDAISFPWKSDVWSMMCRPSHDGWAELTMRNARRAGAGVLYVGLPKNYRRDMGYVRSKCLGKVGKEGEKLYFIPPYSRKPKKV